MTNSKSKGIVLDGAPLDLDKLPQANRSPLQSPRGYVYVIELTNHMVKVGKTGHPRRRLAQHRSEGELHGYEISRAWISPEHSGTVASEARLIAYGGAHGACVGPRLEYFKGLDFDAVVRYAELYTYESHDDVDEDASVAIKAMYNGAQAHLAAYMASSSDPDTAAQARECHVGLAFGRSFYHEWDLPEQIEAAPPAEVVDRVRWLAKRMGVPPVLLLDMNTIDVLEETILAMAREVANELRQHAGRNELYHLIDPLWAHVKWPDDHESIPCCQLFGPGACDHSNESDDLDGS